MATFCPEHVLHDQKKTYLHKLLDPLSQKPHIFDKGL